MAGRPAEMNLDDASLFGNQDSLNLLDRRNDHVIDSPAQH